MIIPLGPKKWRTKFFKIKAIVPKKNILANFFSVYPLWQTWSNRLLETHEVFWHFWCKIKDHFFITQESVENTNFWKKKAKLPVKKFSWANISRIVEHDKRQRKTYKGPQGNLTLTEEVIRSFLKDLRAWWKHKFFEKRQSFYWRKKRRLLFFSCYRLWQTSRNDL